ncbi:MAG: hypothetical protein GF346_07415, partial [Candidatus Eisenbacteria bacterium]|nr:hypothetical protein [Candidatus Latescibacterota bacterium]MBD3302260.1 hypothetical protein [Candidatus Eisenbacteria bacterium]
GDPRSLRGFHPRSRRFGARRVLRGGNVPDARAGVAGPRPVPLERGVNGGGRLLPLLLVALFLGALAGALASLAGPDAYLPRLLGLGAIVSFAAFLYRARREIGFLFVRARRVSEPGPAITWLLAAAVFGVGALVLARAPVRMDWTERGLNRLSEASRAVLEANDAPIELIGVFREDDPRRARAFDVLETYRKSAGRIRVEMVDPDRRPDRARQLGLNRSAVVLVRSGGVVEEALELTEASISQAILRAENPRRLRIAFVTGHGERRLSASGRGGLAPLAASLREVGYEPAEVSLLEAPIGEETAVLALIGPRRELLPAEITRLREHLDGGGRLLLCLEPGADAGLGELLRGSGVILDSLEVFDESPATRGLGFGPRVVVASDYADHPILRGGMGYTVFPGVRRIGLAEEMIWGVNAEPLIRTGPRARLVGLEEEPGETAAEARVRSIAVVQEWEVTGTGEARPGEPVPEKPFARLVVVGDSDWLSGGGIELFSNRDLATRSFHWLARREFLLRVPPLDRSGTPIRIGLGGLRTLSYLLGGAVPLVLLGVGIWLWARRR